jgi:hypothetical protein
MSCSTIVSYRVAVQGVSYRDRKEIPVVRPFEYWIYDRCRTA